VNAAVGPGDDSGGPGGGNAVDGSYVGGAAMLEMVGADEGAGEDDSPAQAATGSRPAHVNTTIAHIRRE
jgi:hypothetical protein